MKNYKYSICLMTAIVFFSPGVEYFFVWNNSYYIHAESFRILGHQNTGLLHIMKLLVMLQTSFINL